MPNFGTSGLRGLVADLTPELISSYVRAFLRSCRVGTGIYVGRDLRESSPRIAQDVISTATTSGVTVTDCGAISTPALAFSAMRHGASAIMVTGSHIPADRNGLKFYTPDGEITKEHESAIMAALESKTTEVSASKNGLVVKSAVEMDFLNRYLAAFGPNALSGRKIGVWSHSAVSRDLLQMTIAALGGNVLELGRTEKFTPIDTEAIPEVARNFLRQSAKYHNLNAIVSTDGDGDRPLVTDEYGEVIPGDILGQITAGILNANVVVTPLSSNTGVETSRVKVVRTRIGSPFVIAKMEEEILADASAKVVGYEANGGFLLGFEAELASPLPRLITRDSFLPILAPLSKAGEKGLRALVAAEPKRFTASDRLEHIPSVTSLAFIADLAQIPENQSQLLSFLGSTSLFPAHLDTSDGLRLTLDNGRIIHLRSSGNSPELRIYTEAESAVEAQSLLNKGCNFLRIHLANLLYS